MFAAVVLFVFLCLTATANADHHHPCHSPNMTGYLSVINHKGEVKAGGGFTYDSIGNKLRFRSNESSPVNTSLTLDLLVFFDEGVFYEIDSKNHSCAKKTLHCTMNPLDVPDDATLGGTMHIGSASVKGEGLKVKYWTGSMSGKKDSYFMSTTMGCLPVSTVYYSDSSSLIFSAMEVHTEIKDPELLIVPPLCVGQPLEETPEGTVNSFLHEFM